MFLLNLPVFNMTMVDTSTNMAAIFDGNDNSCSNIDEVIASPSYLKTNKINTSLGNVVFDVKVHGVTSCLNYEFLFVLVKNEPCDFVRSCNVTHDLATSHNSCIINCPCDDNCDIVAMIYSIITNVVGSLCEIILLEKNSTL